MACPADWQNVSIRDVTLRFENWARLSEPRSTIRYIDVSAVARATLTIENATEHPIKSAPSRAQQRVLNGDTMVATIRPRLRRVCQVPESLDKEIASTAFCVLRPDRQRINQGFLFFSLITDRMTEAIAERETGASYPAVRNRDVLDQSICLPPLQEQIEISRTLGLIRAAIFGQHKALQVTKLLKEATTRYLFRRGLRGEAQKNADIGHIPESWQMKSLGEVAEIVYGAQAAVASSTDPALGIPILTNVNITLDGEIDLAKKRYYAVPANRRDRLILRKGDVLFNWRSGSAEHVGKSAYFDEDEELTYSSFILRFRPCRFVSGKFLYRYLKYLHTDGFFSSRRNVSSINSVYNASLSATIPIWFPTCSEQRNVVYILDTIDRKILLQKRKKLVLERLFNALLDKLMAAEIRVSQLDLSVLGEAEDRVEATA